MGGERGGAAGLSGFSTGWGPWLRLVGLMVRVWRDGVGWSKQPDFASKSRCPVRLSR